MKLYLLRHGETDWNKIHRLQGQSDVPLNAFGRHLAEVTAQGLRDTGFDIAYTSPLSRARETAKLVLAGRNVPIIEEPRLKEMNFGEFEGLCCGREGWNIPDPDFHYFFDAPERFRPARGGESFQQFSDRLEDFLRELYAQEELQDKNLLISAHGAAIRGLMRLMRGLPLHEFWQGSVHKNCGVTTVEVTDGKARILSENVVYYTDEVQDW